MAIFDSTPADSEARKLGAQRIRELKSTLNTVLGQIFSDVGPGYLLKPGIIGTDQLVTVPDLVAGTYNNLTVDVKGRVTAASNVSYKAAADVETVLAGGTGLSVTPADSEVLSGTGSGYELRKLGIGLSRRAVDYPSAGTKYVFAELTRRIEFTAAGVSYWQAPFSGLVRGTATGGGGGSTTSVSGGGAGTGIGYFEVTAGSWYAVTVGSGGNTSGSAGTISKIELIDGLSTRTVIGAPLVYGEGGTATGGGAGPVTILGGSSATAGTGGLTHNVGGSSAFGPGSTWYANGVSPIIVPAGIGGGGAKTTGASSNTAGGNGKVLIEW